MTVPLRDVVAALETAYPPATAQSWDRVGLVTGDLDQPVGRVLLALDPTLAVVQEALDRQCDLIVTHHPLLMRGIHSVATGSLAPLPQSALEAITIRRFGSMKIPWPKMPRAAKLPSL